MAKQPDEDPNRDITATAADVAKRDKGRFDPEDPPVQLPTDKDIKARDRRDEPKKGKK